MNFDKGSVLDGRQPVTATLLRLGGGTLANRPSALAGWMPLAGLLLAQLSILALAGHPLLEWLAG